VLQLSANGDPILGFQDENNKARAILGRVTPDISTTPLPERPISSLILLDKDEKVVWKAPE